MTLSPMSHSLIWEFIELKLFSLVFGAVASLYCTDQFCGLHMVVRFLLDSILDEVKIQYILFLRGSW